MKALLEGWNLMRLLRLVLGVAILVQGIVGSDVMTIILGTAFVGMALANVGCCGANGCAVNYRKNLNEKEISYEELDNTK
ncbi:MAG: hypothetical protein LH478_09870 [Chitinophagaceae bacterium]|nr:hypothetical protein [Chitinophagaceae bacterium]